LILKKLLCLFAAVSMATSFPLISNANNINKSEQKKDPLKNWGNFKIGKSKKEKELLKKRLEKDGARTAIEQVELFRMKSLDPKTPLSNYGKLKKQTKYEYIKDFFNPSNNHRLCFQFVFDKYDYPFLPMNSVAVQIASQFLLDGILGKSKNSYINKDYDGFFGIYAMPVGAMHVDYPIYVRDDKARNKLQKILNNNYYNEKNFENIVNSIVDKISKNDKYFEKVRLKIIKKFKACIDYCYKKIDSMKDKEDKFYIGLGRSFLSSMINTAIDNIQDKVESVAFAKNIEKLLKENEEVKKIGKNRAKEIIKNLEEFKKECKKSIDILEEKDPSYYNKVVHNENSITDKITKYSLKDVVVGCLKKMRKKTTRPVLYNNGDERHILKLEIKYDGMD